MVDILEQYKKELPKEVPKIPAKVPVWELPDEETGFLTRLIMKLSGGKIRDKQTASKALIAVSIIFFLATLFVIF